uniref:(California timema) hypothetical protein n=1 Tax=Timema californicum TaxID=61474 RepID=A0A7R9IW73_TIMCA|nr:unnamed protein product [Timema californicum]
MIHPTEIRTSISPSSAVKLNTTSALANYANDAVHPTEIRTSISPPSAVEFNTTSAFANYATEAAEKCKTPFSRGFNQTEKNAIVNEHNRLRNIVALGKESRGNPGPQPSAANMRKIVIPSSAGHYTQVVWANTHQVGCGYIRYPGKSSHSTTVVCNYKPGGNILSAAIYKVGKPCSDCPKGTKCDTKYQGLCEGVAAACNTPFSRGFNQTEKDAIVNEHNRLRNIVALGKESRGSPGPQPSAANMNKISWDDELAGIAQRWVDQCQIDHDSCRRCERFNVGQNICMSGSTIHHRFDPSSQVRAFYDEVKYFNRTDVNCFNIPEPNSEVVGHYTQVVWADTTLVGCGLIYYPDGVWNIYYMACNYGPAGNIIGDSLYKEGTPCSECAGGCDITYTGLCAHDK